jgi:hypothetical protein
MRYLAVILLICSVCWSVYDNSEIEVMSGGQGYMALNGLNYANTQRYWASNYPATAAGTLKNVRWRFYVPNNGQTGANVSEAYFLVYRLDGADWKIAAKVDYLTDIRAFIDSGVGRYEFDEDISSENISIEVGDRIGWFINEVGTTNPIQSACSSGVPTYEADGARQSGDDGDNSCDAVGSTIDLTSVVSATRVFICDFTVMTNEYVYYEDDAGFGDGDYVNLPDTNTGYYITLEGVQVPSGEDLQIRIKHTTDATPQTADTTVKTINLSYDGAGGDDDVIALHNDEVFDATLSQTIAGQESDKFIINIWVDTANDKMDVFFCNVTNGQGGGSAALDITHFSVTDRTLDTLTSDYLKRMHFINTGGNASIDKVIVHRKPFLAVGDSYVSSSSTPTTLAHVGSYLGEAGTETRYVINGGVSGSKMTGPRSTISQSGIDRWDSATGELVAFHDVVYVICGGTNDICTVNACDAAMRVVAADLLKFYNLIIGDALRDGDAYGNINEVVICEFAPYNPAYVPATWPLQEKLCKELINNGLQGLSYAANVPIARVYDAYVYGWGPLDPPRNVHLDAAGDSWVAGEIAQAYEQEIVSSECDGFGLPNCINPPESDISGDCKVNLADLAKMSSEWLVNGTQ